jgi:hypothetical protein
MVYQIGVLGLVPGHADLFAFGWLKHNDLRRSRFHVNMLSEACNKLARRFPQGIVLAQSIKAKKSGNGEGLRNCSGIRRCLGRVPVIPAAPHSPHSVDILPPSGPSPCVRRSDTPTHRIILIWNDLPPDGGRLFALSL